MKIKKLKVSNFRNLKNINIEFRGINILTWKNSTWKTNLTQLLTNCLNINPNIESYFWKNIVTYWPWINQTSIETTMIDNFVYSNGTKDFLTINNFKITFKHIIKKDISYSKEHSLINYSWKEATYKDVNEFIHGQEKKIWDNKWKLKVYEKSFDFVKWFNQWPIAEQSINFRDWRYFDIFEFNTVNAIINYDDLMSFSSCWFNIFNKVIEKNKEKWLEAIDYLNSSKFKSWFSNFKIAKFISLLADIQKNKKQFKKFKDDLTFYTEWILKNVYINTDWKIWSKWDIFVDTPHWPKDIEFISAWTALVLYFVMLKNWLDLEIKSYEKPDIMIFDELDAAIHPILIWKFSDLLKKISRSVQLFITTHSTNFIDNFNRKEVYLLKDIWSFNKKIKVESNVMSYEKIMNSLSPNAQDKLIKISNSDLYINWDIDTFFPII